VPRWTSTPYVSRAPSHLFETSAALSPSDSISYSGLAVGLERTLTVVGFDPVVVADATVTVRA
jgi:hypothetical protein